MYISVSIFFLYRSIFNRTSVESCTIWNCSLSVSAWASDSLSGVQVAPCWGSRNNPSCRWQLNAPIGQTVRLPEAGQKQPKVHILKSVHCHENQESDAANRESSTRKYPVQVWIEMGKEGGHINFICLRINRSLNMVKKRHYVFSFNMFIFFIKAVEDLPI